MIVHLMNWCTYIYIYMYKHKHLIHEHRFKIHADLTWLTSVRWQICLRFLPFLAFAQVALLQLLFGWTTQPLTGLMAGGPMDTITDSLPNLCFF